MIKRDFKRIKRLHIEPFSAAIKKTENSIITYHPRLEDWHSIIRNGRQSSSRRRRRRKTTTKLYRCIDQTANFAVENQQKLGAKRMADERDDAVPLLPDFTLIAVVAI